MQKTINFSGSNEGHKAEGSAEVQVKAIRYTRIQTSLGLIEVHFANLTSVPEQTKAASTNTLGATVSPKVDPVQEKASVQAIPNPFYSNSTANLAPVITTEIEPQTPNLSEAEARARVLEAVDNPASEEV